MASRAGGGSGHPETTLQASSLALALGSKRRWALRLRSFGAPLSAMAA